MSTDILLYPWGRNNDCQGNKSHGAKDPVGRCHISLLQILYCVTQRNFTSRACHAPDATSMTFVRLKSISRKKDKIHHSHCVYIYVSNKTVYSYNCLSIQFTYRESFQPASVISPCHSWVDICHTFFATPFIIGLTNYPIAERNDLTTDPHRQSPSFSRSFPASQNGSLLKPLIPRESAIINKINILFFWKITWM